MQAAAVSPTDTHLVAGYADRDPVKSPPWVPGMDAAGVVVEVGDGVEHVQAGDLAMGIVLPHGRTAATARTWSCPADSVVRAPAGADAARGLDAADERPDRAARARPDGAASRAGPRRDRCCGAFGGYVVQLPRPTGSPSSPTLRGRRELVRELGPTRRPPGRRRRADPRALPRRRGRLADGSVQDALASAAVRTAARWPRARLSRRRAARLRCCRPGCARCAGPCGLDRLRQQTETASSPPRRPNLPGGRGAEAHRTLAGWVRGAGAHLLTPPGAVSGRDAARRSAGPRRSRTP